MRNMTVEYLRVVFISLIVLLHILWNDYGGRYVAWGDNSPNIYVQLGLTNLVSLGVTGFILISGYYGITLKVNRIVSLWIQTTMYALLSALMVWVFWGGSLLGRLINAPLSLFDGWWFINDYVILMLLSPLLNCGLEKISKKSLEFIIVVLTFMMYGVWWFHAKNSSMPLLLFFNTYIIGRYIRIYPIGWLEKYKYTIFIAGLTVLVSELMILHLVGLDGKMKFACGNFNVLILVVDIALLLICNEHQKMGKGNMLTKNVLAVYLIHTCGFGQKVLHEKIFYDGLNFNIAYILSVVVVVVVVCTIVEEVRKRLFYKFESYVTSKSESLLKYFFCK